jgi:hypothetical protein
MSIQYPDRPKKDAKHRVCPNRLSENLCDTISNGSAIPQGQNL